MKLAKFLFLLWCLAQLHLRLFGVVFNGVDYPVPLDGVSDAQPGLKMLFQAVEATPGAKRVVLPSGKYLMGLVSATNSIRIPSDTTVDASAAEFLLPIQLPKTNSQYPYFKTFVSTDVTNVTWKGGSVVGHVFDLHASDPSTNVWQPKETTAFLYFNSSQGRGCERITIQNLAATNLSGPAVAFIGLAPNGSTNVTHLTTCRDVALSNCALINCGFFFWDYSYLLQIICYSNHYSPAQWAMATNYMRPGLILGPVQTIRGSTLIGFSNPGLVPLATNSMDPLAQYPDKLVTFYGVPPHSTPQLIAGNPYFVVQTNANGIVVSTNFGGAPVVFDADSHGEFGLIKNIASAGSGMFQPWGQVLPLGPQAKGYSGAFHFVACDGVTVSGCTWSSAGDSSQFLQSANITLTGNEVRPSRMGGLIFIDSVNAVVSNNFFNLGPDGSRAITLEPGFVPAVFGNSSNIMIVSNIFNGGGRGFLLNNPVRTTIANNIFHTNTTKAYRDYNIGRIGPEYGGDWEREYLFDFRIENQGTFGGVAITNNQIQTDTAVYLASFNGGNFTNITFADNVIYGSRVDGTTPSNGWVYGYPAIPPLRIFYTPLYNSMFDRNQGLETQSEGVYCATFSQSVSNVSFPHFLPTLWPSSSGSLYTDSGDNLKRIPVGAGGGYFPTVVPDDPALPPISAVSMDATNIVVEFSAPLPALSKITLNWTARQPIAIGRDADVEDYIARVLAVGGNIDGNVRGAFYNLVDSLKQVGWNKFVDIYPLYGGWPAALEKLKFRGSEPRLRNVDSAGGASGLFTAQDYSVRGLKGDGLTKSLQLSLSPLAIVPVAAVGFSAFVTDSKNFVPPASSYLLGADDGVNDYGLKWSGSGLDGAYGGLNSVATLPGSALLSPQFYGVGRSGLSDLELFAGGARVARDSSLIVMGNSKTVNLRLFARANSDNHAVDFFPGTLGFVTIENGYLPEFNRAAMYNAIVKWMQAIGRLP